MSNVTYHNCQNGDCQCFAVTPTDPHDFRADSAPSDFSFQKYDPSAKVKTWTTRDGYELKIKKMTSGHIFNCLALLARKDAKDHPAFKAFLLELLNRGEFDVILPSKVK